MKILRLSKCTSVDSQIKIPKFEACYRLTIYNQCLWFNIGATQEGTFLKKSWKKGDWKLFRRC